MSKIIVVNPIPPSRFLSKAAGAQVTLIALFGGVLHLLAKVIVLALLSFLPV